MAKLQDTKKAIDDTIENVIKPEAEKVMKVATDVAKTTSESAKEAAQKASKATSTTVAKASKAATETVSKATKATTEKVTKATKVASEKVKEVKASITEELVLQYAGKEMTPQQIMEAAKAQYVAEGHKASDIKGIKVYVKPEDGRAYFVVNESYAGSIAL